MPVLPFPGVTDDTLGAAAEAGVPTPPAMTTPVVADTISFRMLCTRASSLSVLHVCCRWPGCCFRDGVGARTSDGLRLCRGSSAAALPPDARGAGRPGPSHVSP